MRVDTLRIVGSSGTNKVMTGELARLSKRHLSRFLPKPKKAGSGAIVFSFDADLAQLALRYHRTCTRVLWDLYQSDAARLEPLYDELLADVGADDRQVFRNGDGISVRARNVSAFAAGERQIVGAVKNAIIDGMASRGVDLSVQPQQPDVELVVRMRDDILTVSVDLAGRSMSKRGYRRDAGEAPLREHMAAVLLMLARYNPRTDILLEPMAGSGTIAIEGALMARATPLWRDDTKLTAHSLPAFEGRSWDAEPLFADAQPAVIANEIDGTVVTAMRRNIARAGVETDLAVVEGDFRELDVQRVAALARRRNPDLTRGLILSNPPFGRRLTPDDLAGLYRDLGRFCAQFAGWRAGFLVANPDFESLFGQRPAVKKPLTNASLRGYFYLYEL